MIAWVAAPPDVMLALCVAGFASLPMSAKSNWSFASHPSGQPRNFAPVWTWLRPTRSGGRTQFTRFGLNRRIDEGEMPKVSFDFHTAVPPERVMAMLTDFSPNRPVVWPMLAPELYEVYRLDSDHAYVKEGSTFPRRIFRCPEHVPSLSQMLRKSAGKSNFSRSMPVLGPPRRRVDMTSDALIS